MRIKKMVVISVLCSMVFCAAGAVPVKKVFAAQTETALLEAASAGDTETVETLLKHGANINAQDNDGGTALIWAAVNGHTKTVETLLKHGADINAQDNEGVTALMHAASAGDTKTVKILLKHGANINVQDNEGYTALMLTDDDEIEKILREFGAK